LLDETLEPGATGSDLAPVAAFEGIAVLGSHPATVELAPFSDPSWLIYACSPHNVEQRRLPRWDQWFEIHLPAAHSTRSYHYLRGLEEQSREKQERGENPIVWMRDQAALPHFPGSRLYPEQEMKELFCPFLFSSSIAFILAKAIVDAEKMGIKQIGLWGILQASKPEYLQQRPGTQYFLWEAARRGIKVLAAQESGLFEVPPETF
jgi:hypothetical protein